MTYQVLYRTWRPQAFEDLVGQEPIRRTLENAISQNRISHAYLFAGPRGTGKTSTARILAKALNCSDLQGSQPCGHCESCLAIQKGNSMDVLEIDAASNRGIEEIRDLKEKMGFLPALGRFKVYIIDEVHMLTMEAFNALLKTLEEPPEHVVFVLATTDVQKLPPTILSRCQRFDFHKITPDVIRQRLMEITASLQIPVTEDVYELIIKRADGGLRDAISLLDQCLAYSPESLDGKQAYKVLGLVQHETLQALTEAIRLQEPQNLFLLIDQLIREGVEPTQILRDMSEYCRNLIMLLVCGRETDLVICTQAERTVLLEQAQAFGLGRLQSMLVALDTAYGNKVRGNSRFMVEALLAGLMQFPVVSAAGQATVAGEVPVTTPVATPAVAPTSQASSGHSISETEQQPPVVFPTCPAQTKVAKSTPSRAKKSGEGLTAADWDKVMQEVKTQRIVLHAFLTASVHQELQDQVLTINFDPEKGKFHKERSEEAENRRILQEVVNKVLGTDIKLQYDFLKKKVETDPIKKALAIFGEEIVEIKK